MVILILKKMNSAGISVVKTGVGDKYVVEEMKKMGNLGEQSGHIIFWTTPPRVTVVLRLSMWR